MLWYRIHMDICPVCLLPVFEPTKIQHMQFHKRYNQHMAMCAAHYAPMYTDHEDRPIPNPCTCLMQSVYL